MNKEIEVILSQYENQGPPLKWGEDRRYDMIATLLRPGTLDQWIRDYHAEIKAIYESKNRAQTFGEWVIQVWFHFHDEKVDRSFS